MGKQHDALQRSLARLSRDLNGQPEASVLEALRGDGELAEWGWTDVRLTAWAHQIAANEPVVLSPE